MFHQTSSPATTLPPSPYRVAVPALRSRNEPRSAYRVPCRIECVDELGLDSTLCIGLTVNLSASGVSVHLPEPLGLETEVVVTVPRPEGPNLCATGRVIHCRRVLSGTFEVGIAFSPPA